MKYEKIYKKSPVLVQNLIIFLYNFLAYKKRNKGKYSLFLEEFRKNIDLNEKQLLTIQKERFRALIDYTLRNSNFYKELYEGIKDPNILENIENLPIVNKEIIRSNCDRIYTIDKNKGHIGKTGGTTGKSLEVVFTFDNLQERMAMLDAFRSSLGYELGKKTAWFSGKDIITARDVRKNRFWKSDFVHKVRYYSTFHIKNNNLKFYIENIIKFKPQFIVGFPSSILDIAEYGLKNNIDFPKNIVNAIFPTAEKVNRATRGKIESFFKTKLYDQYASSEGAPFIIECKKGNLHMELQSGVFEVLDSDNKPATSGRLVFTSFTTYGTPLIRYDIGDEIVMSTRTCDCGNQNPVVEEILGRENDFIYSKEVGKINLGNLSNVLKDVKGVVKFQVIQDDLNILDIFVIKDHSIFDSNSETIFVKNLRARVGSKIQLRLKYVDDIANERSGKYRLIKNNIKNLIS